MWADRRALSYVQRSSTFPKPPLRISTSSHAASPFESFATTEKRAGGPGPLAACRPVGSADLGGEAKLVNREVCRHLRGAGRWQSGARG
jgi:hypothetical protein